jgi:AcrR family transcriptional regulator
MSAGADGYQRIGAHMDTHQRDARLHTVPSQSKQARSTATRHRLISAAESLVAEWGIEAVNLRDVGRLAEQHNNSVVQYHFGTKELLVGAVIDARLPNLIDRYGALLEAVERTSDLRPAAIASLIVDPLAELAASEGHGQFVGFMAAMLTAPHWRASLLERDDVVALFERLTAATARAGVSPARLPFAWLVSVLGLATSPDRDLDEVRRELVDAVTGLMTAPSRSAKR